MMNNNALRMIQDKIVAHCKLDSQLKKIRADIKLLGKRLDTIKQNVITIPEWCNDKVFIDNIESINHDIYEKMDIYNQSLNTLLIEYNRLVIVFCKENVADIHTIEKVMGDNILLNEHTFMRSLFSRDYF